MMISLTGRLLPFHEDFNLKAVQVHVHDLCDAAILRPLLMLATHFVAFVRPAHASYLTPNPDPF